MTPGRKRKPPPIKRKKGGCTVGTSQKKTGKENIGRKKFTFSFT